MISLISFLFAASLTSTSVKYHSTDIIPLKCRVRFTTVVILPKEERILDYLVGDRDFWRLEGAANYAYLKPAREGASTSVTLITEAGTVYSFLAQETSKSQHSPDLKVFVELADEALLENLRQRPSFVRYEEAERLKSEIVLLRESMNDEISSEVISSAQKVRFDYDFKKGRKPFFVSIIWHDDRNTYIRSYATEKPALYEVTDTGPALVDFVVDGNLYVVHKVLNRAYLQIGKKRFEFHRGGY